MPPPAPSTQNPAPKSQEPVSKKLLIITYYWPPSGGSGVQRWLKFVKYLPSLGWHPYVFTPEKPSVEIQDDSLLKDIPAEAEVLHFPIWEPYNLFNGISKLMGRRSVSQIDRVATGKKSFFQSLTGWVRGNVFIPDGRIFWVKPSVRFLPDFLKSNGITTVITTGPPHSLHLIGMKLKKKDPALRWIADFRDPWSEWDLLDTFSMTSWARKKHRKLERKVLKKADRVITIAPFHVKRFETLGGRSVDLVTNGFDEDDFAAIHRTRTEKFTIRHIGMVDELRDPKPFMNAVRMLARQSPDFLAQTKIEFIGAVNSTFREFVENDKLLSAVVVFSQPLTHTELIRLYGETDVQLLILAHTALAPGNLPGKFFEYLASGNFIFGVGPEGGDAAQILKATQTGIMIDRKREDEIGNQLKLRFEAWQKGGLVEIRDVSSFSRKTLTKQLSDLIG